MAGEGLGLVFNKQGGTGAAWKRPNSSFDVVEFSKAKPLMDAAMQKQKDQQQAGLNKSFYDNLKVATADRLQLSGQELIDGISNNFLQYKAKDLMGRPNPNPTQADILETEIFQNDIKQLNENQKRRALDTDTYVKLIENDKDAVYDTEAMKKNATLMYDPLKSTDPTVIGEIENEMADAKIRYPYADAKTLRRVAADQWAGKNWDKISEVIYNPIDLTEDFNKKRSVLLNEVTQGNAIRNQDGTVMTQSQLLVSPDDQTVVLENGQQVTIPGTKSTAESNYLGSKQVRDSVKKQFGELSESRRDYYKQFGEDAPLRWYQDQFGRLGQKVEGKENITGGDKGNAYSFGGKSLSSEYQITPDERSANLNRGDGSYVGGKVMGFSIKDKNGRGIQLNPNVTTMWNQDDSAQIPMQNAKNVQMDDVKPIKAAALVSSIDITQPQYARLREALETDPKYKNSRLRKDGIIEAGVILADDEVALLESLGLGNLMQDQKFIQGNASYMEEEVDEKSGDRKQVKKYIEGAIVPWQDGVAELNTKTGNNWDWDYVLDTQYPDRKYGQIKQKPPVYNSVSGGGQVR